VRYTAGVVLDGEDLVRLARLVRDGVVYRQRTNGGGVQPADLSLRDQLLAFAAETASVQVSEPAKAAKVAASVTVAESLSAEMTVQAAAGLLGISPQAVRGLCRTGDLIATRDAAGRWQIDADSAAALAARRKGQA